LGVVRSIASTTTGNTIFGSEVSQVAPARPSAKLKASQCLEVHMMGSGMFEYPIEEIIFCIWATFQIFYFLILCLEGYITTSLKVLGVLIVDRKILTLILRGLLQMHAVQRGIWVATLHLFWH
jgi:hypothetical protein